MKKQKISCFEVSVTGGELKGRKILIPDIATTRSSKSILRESLFNTLQFDIIDAPFVEVFAGSGSVGIEAISRGAAHGYFFENNRDVYEILQHNLHHLAHGRATAIQGDSFSNFPILLQRLNVEEVPAYFYFDPPFSIREGMEEIYDKTLDLIMQIDPKICKSVMVEHMSTLKLPDVIGTLRRKKQKRFGKSTLSYYDPSGV
jgi:16S rRNA (guanine(966)-N(2))-methyltransferase RsmD